ncbi:LysR family transcriptional regulator [Parendozoicomonas haliclonae]|nr:LysR family transcriptional regulator [Parendozoicomonas haliclonae]
MPGQNGNQLDGLSLSRLNLNLLPSLKALLDTRSVTDAAKLLCVTQPTMSRNLAQLRENLCDPILVRSCNRTELSELAKSIHPSVNHLVIEAATIFENASFDPQTTCRHFRIAGSYAVVEKILPGVLCELRKLAPNFTFDVELLNEHVIEKLHRGEIDLALGYSGQPPSGLRSQEIMRCRLACMMSATHPLADRIFTLEELTEYPHLMQKGGCGMSSQVKSFYERIGIEPQMSISSFCAAKSVVAGSDYICLHTPIKEVASEGLVLRELPDEVVEIDHRMVWPEYWNANRSHRWLRDHLFQSLRRFVERNDEPGYTVLHRQAVA